MASLTQGSPLPNITQTTSQSTTVPQFYQDYLTNLATKGATALAGATFAGPSALQTQAFNTVGQNTTNYQPELTAAQGTVNSANPQAGLAAASPYLAAGTNPAYNTVGNYMSPYVGGVVNEIGRLGEQNLNQTLLPGVEGAAVGSGQFGSQRGAQVEGQTIRDAMQNITGQQANALNTGYQNAMTAAQTGNAQNLTAAGTAGQLAATGTTQQLAQGQQQGALAAQTQTQGLAGVNALGQLGNTQQQLNQAQTMFPFTPLSDYASLMSGLQIPTSSTTTATGPGNAGQYGLSGLSNILGTGSALSSIYNALPTLSSGSGIGSALTAAAGMLGFKEGGAVRRSGLDYARAA